MGWSYANGILPPMTTLLTHVGCVEKGVIQHVNEKHSQFNAARTFSSAQCIETALFTMAQNVAAALPVLQPTIAAPLWLDPLYYVLPAGDEVYQQALQFRSMHTHSFSRLDGLCASIGYALMFYIVDVSRTFGA